MYDKKVNLEKLCEYADFEYPHIFVISKKDDHTPDGCIDGFDGLLKEKYFGNYGLNESLILNNEKPTLKACEELLKNDYQLFFNLGMIEHMGDWGDDKGKYYIDETIEISLDFEKLFKKYKIFESSKKVIITDTWDDKYLDNSKYKICLDKCDNCSYCHDDELESEIVFFWNDEEFILHDLIDSRIYRQIDLNVIQDRIGLMERLVPSMKSGNLKDIMDSEDDLSALEFLHQKDEEFKGYTSGYYGVYVQKENNKYLCDYGYCSEEAGVVCFVGPDFTFYHLDEIETNDEVKKTFVQLLDDGDFYI